ncbi:pentapeptide repeat-containing protein [Streptomyces sp. NPDC058420]|uniref:pentapeptide repeat-containing protein n=1 Tax=Streptomyces sp. NPDC058420 TaxID=3346489 RepID=UPI003649C6CE
MTDPAAPPSRQWTECSQPEETSDSNSRCRGEVVEPYSKCLSHLSTEERARHFNSMHERPSVSYQGTTIDPELFRQAIAALNHGNTQAYFTDCKFTGAILSITGTFQNHISFASSEFEGIIQFSDAEFLGGIEFTGAHFKDSALFGNVKFHEGASFDGVHFSDWANFEEAIFTKDAFFQDSHFKKATFDGAQFLDWALFEGASFNTEASFNRATFENAANFTNVTFEGFAQFIESRFFGATEFHNVTVGSDGAFFNKARFTEMSRFGPIRCEQVLDLSHAHFEHPVLLDVDAGNVSLRHAVFASHASVQIARAYVDLTHAVLNQPVDIIGAPLTLNFETGAVQTVASLTSLRGVDCAMLTVASLSLTNCTFSGVIHLDQLRLEGRWYFNRSPRGYSAIPPFRHTSRQVIEEERRRRALSGRSSSHRTWGGGPIDRTVPRYDALAIIYRQLRKSREDAKDEPGAADFYYGEMEMRRLSCKWGTSERWLLQLYWLLSGYGLRASRALGWLALAMLTTILLLMAFGLPQSEPKQEAVGIVPPNGGMVTFEIDKENPKNPSDERLSSARFEKSLKVTLTSVVFRSSGQDLTTSGDYIEMASRFSEPVLLGLAVLAVRGRVKR